MIPRKMAAEVQGERLEVSPRPTPAELAAIVTVLRQVRAKAVAAGPTLPPAWMEATRQEALRVNTAGLTPGGWARAARLRR